MKIRKQAILIHMAEKKMTMTDLAAASKVSRQQLSVIIAKGICTPASAGKIAEGLGVDVTEILKKEED